MPRKPADSADPADLESAPDLDVLPLTGDRFADIAAVFEEGGDPKWCWCTYFRIRGQSWSNSTPASNRSFLSKLAKREPSDHPAPGLIGYLDGRAVGWISLGPRENYDRLAYSKLLAPIDDRPVWSIVCFVVSRLHRRKGVAAGLLQAGIAYARDRGARTLEAYPIDTGGARISSASAFHGTLSMFQDAGFKVAARRQWNGSSPPRPIVRLELRPLARKLTPRLRGG